MIRKRETEEIHRFESLSFVLDRVIKSFGLEKGSRSPLKKNTRLKEEWGKLVGKPISDHTKPMSVRKGVLTVFVDSSPWLHELNNHGKKALLDVLQKNFPHILQIRFRIK